MNEVRPETIPVVKPRKKVTLQEIKRAMGSKTLKEASDCFDTALGVYFSPEDPFNPFPGHHTIGIDENNPELRDEPLRREVLYNLLKTQHVPFIQELATKFILSFRQLPLNSDGNTRITAVRAHEEMHELQSLRFGDIQKIQQAKKLMDQLTALSKRRDPKEEPIGTIGNTGVRVTKISLDYQEERQQIEEAEAKIANALLKMKALHEAQAMAAEIKTPKDDQNGLILNVYYVTKRVLVGFKSHNGLDTFAVVAEHLRNNNTLLERSGVGPMQHAMGAVALLLQNPNVWHDVAAGKLEYRQLRLAIKKAIMEFLADPQKTVQRINNRDFQIELDQTLIESIRNYHAALQAAEAFLVKR